MGLQQRSSQHYGADLPTVFADLVCFRTCYLLHLPHTEVSLNAKANSFTLDIYPIRVYNSNTPQGYGRNGVMDDMKKCACCEKTTERSDEERKKLIHRLNRIEGQIRGIRKMVEKDAYCADILVQSAAVNAAVNAFNKELLASHIRGCVARDIRNGNDEVIDELVVTLQKLMK